MSKNYKLSESRYNLDQAFNLRVNIGENLLTISALEILELGKMILTEFQSRAKMPVVAVKTANIALKSSTKKTLGRPKGSKNKKRV